MGLQNYEFISNQHSFMVTIFCSTFDKVKYKCYLGSETNFRKRAPHLIMGQLSLHSFLLTQTKQISLQFFSVNTNNISRYNLRGMFYFKVFYTKSWEETSYKSALLREFSLFQPRNIDPVPKKRKQK